MNRDRQESIARLISVLCGVIVAACVAFLFLDYLEVRRVTPGDTDRVKALEEAVKGDARIAFELTAERERQTLVSMARDLTNETVGTVLLFASALFLTGMKWRNALDRQPELPMEKLVALRAIPATVAKATAGAGSAAGASPGPVATGEEIDLDEVDRIVEQEGRAREAAIPILRAIQSHYGYLPDEALKKVCGLTDITPAQIAGTSSFYAQFRRSPVGKHVVRVCHGTACHVSGIVQVSDEMRRYLAIASDADTDPRRLFTLDKVACLGCCSLAPVMMIDEHTVGRLTPSRACEALHAAEPEAPST